eukprot:jgi/Bigna1/52072/estExt_Genewise1Plus.C_50106
MAPSRRRVLSLFTPATSGGSFARTLTTLRFKKFAQRDGNDVKVSNVRTLATRPTSPDVKIYKFPVAALSSITNRITGVLLSIGCAGVGAAAITIDCNVPVIIDSIKTSAPVLVPAMKLCVGFPLVYHYLGGVRHLVWDYTLKGLDISSMEQSSYALFGGSAVISLVLAFVTF